MRNVLFIALLAAYGSAIGCSAASRGSSTAPDCGCGEEPDGGDCVDTEPDSDGGVPGWRLTWAAQAGGDKNDNVFPYEIAWDLAPLPDSSILVSGRYQYEGLFGAGEPNETTLPLFGPEGDWENTSCFVARYGRDGELLWAQGYGGLGWEAGALGVAPAGEGALWSLGAYEQDVTIGLGQPNETSLVPDSFDESWMYSHVLAKYSTDGQLEWAIRAVDAGGNALFHGSAVLPDGSIAIAGDFTIGIALAPDTPEETILTTPGTSDEDGAVARFAADGTLLWARQISGPGIEFIWNLTRLLGGELLAAGTYQQTVVLGAGEEHETALTCGAGEPDAGPDGGGERCPFVAAFDEDGALLWARDLGYSCPVQDVFPMVEAAPDGGFAIAGGFVGTAVLGQGEPNETVVGPTPEDKFDVLVARYAANGSLLWARQSAGGLDDPTTMDWYTGYPMAFLDSGELVLAGYYRWGAPVFGQGEPHEAVLPYANRYRVFLAMFYPNGNLAWAIDQGVPGSVEATTMAAYGDSTFFVGGTFDDTVTFGTSTADQETMTSNGDSEIFVLRFDRTE